MVFSGMHVVVIVQGLVMPACHVQQGVQGLGALELKQEPVLCAEPDHWHVILGTTDQDALARVMESVPCVQHALVEAICWDALEPTRGHAPHAVPVPRARSGSGVWEPVPAAVCAS